MGKRTNVDLEILQVNTVPIFYTENFLNAENFTYQYTSKATLHAQDILY